MIQAHSPAQLLQLDLPTLTERYILAAAGASSNVTTYETHQVLLRMQEPSRGEFSIAELDLRQHYERHLQKAFHIHTEPLTPAAARVFDGPFITGRTLIITDAGDLAFSGQGDRQIVAGNVLMIETPPRRMYDFVYREGYETVLPPHVVMRAHIKMHVAKTNQALVYVVGDNHEIEDFISVVRDDNVIEDLIQSCRRAVQRVIDHDPPKPDITEDALLIEERNGNPPLIVDANSNVFPVMRDYLDAIAEEKRASEPHNKAKTLLDQCKIEVQKLMAEHETNRVIMPNKTQILRKLVKTKEYTKPSGSYTRLDIKQPAA